MIKRYLADRRARKDRDHLRAMLLFGRQLKQEAIAKEIKVRDEILRSLQADLDAARKAHKPTKPILAQIAAYTNGALRNG